jgi:hypothetical protein
MVSSSLSSRFWAQLHRTVVATVSAYLLFVVVGEPSNVFGATSDTESAVIQVTLGAAIGMNCDADGSGAGSGETLSLSSITEYGDTGPLNGTVTVGTNAVVCNIRTNNSAGYDLSWRVTTGSGGTKTGYMISQFEDVIAPFNYSASNAESVPAAWNGGTTPSNSQAAWGGRLSSTSDEFANSPVSWGNNGVDGTEKWMKVSSGTTTVIATGNDSTPGGGENQYLGFRVEVGSDKIQPTGVYRVTVVFTAATQ